MDDRSQNRAHGLDPAEWHRVAAEEQGAVLLETARGDAENRARYLFLQPERVLAAGTLDEIPAVFEEIEAELAAGRFAAGFLSYEAGYHFEPAALRGAGVAAGEMPVPLAWFGVYPAENVRCGPAGAAEYAAGNEMEDEVGAVSLSQAEYGQRIERIRRLIEAGDLYQANFTIEIRRRWSAGAEVLFARMMANQPVSYGALVNLGEMQILSASPELFFRRAGDAMVVRPMKGTAQRGRDIHEDAEQAAWLASDEKNRAENVMIVDLLRSDLGRICRAGSIRVSELFAVERYPGLLQMTSTVRGELEPGTSYYQIFRSLFPCGSITGAPKIRTMQAIRELEGSARGMACGAIGFFAPRREAVFSVAIRTLLLRNGEMGMRVGSGITHDSNAREEYDECLLKAAFLSRPPRDFGLIETMLWERGFFLLEEHLKRLEASARYFDFCFDEVKIREQLSEFANTLDPAARHRVRMVLGKPGGIAIASEPLKKAAFVASIAMARERVDSADVFLRHKTTRREIYDRAFDEARAGGFDDALFLNERGEVTECAIHNVMIEKDGLLLTPRLECGLLPGVYREHLLKTQPEMREAVLSLGDVLGADRLYVFNSVREVRVAELVNE